MKSLGLTKETEIAVALIAMSSLVAKQLADSE
jgi:hypothetical protein